MLGPPGIFAASRHALLNTDDRAYIEYHAAERLLRVTEAAFLDARLRRASLRRSPHVDYRLETPAASKRLRTRLNDYHRAEELLLQAEVVRGAQGIDQNFRTLLRQIGLLVPSHPYYRAFAQ